MTEPEWPAPLADHPHTGADRIAAERERQITAEGYTPEGDHGHAADLFAAAACYALAAARLEAMRDDYRYYTMVAHMRDGAPELWPWAPELWKPEPDHVRNAEKAGALLAAGIDALLAEQRTPTPERN